MAPSSSASKVAKLAQKGKGKKVRFQGGTLFPAVITIIVLLFGGLIVYARESRPGPGEGSPTANDHWHAAFGTYVCDEFGLKQLPKLTGNLEELDASGQYVSTRFSRNGIHSHDDGVMHWHPSSSGRATGTNAKLGVFLANYGITLTNSKLTLPPEQSENPEGDVYEEGKTTCKIDGEEKKASLKLWVWDSYTKINEAPTGVYTTNMDDVRISNDGMVFQLAFVPDDVDPVAPDWASKLPELGAADGGQVVPTEEGTVGSDVTATDTAGTGTVTTDSASGEPSATSTDGTTGDTTAGTTGDTTAETTAGTTAETSASPATTGG